MFKRWLQIKRGFSSLTIGPRRSGKMTLLKNLFPDIPYITLDDLDILDWAKRDPKGLIQSLGESAIIDEIQRHPLLTVAVKYAIDNLGAHFYMTGSSSLGLLVQQAKPWLDAPFSTRFRQCAGAKKEAHLPIQYFPTY